MTSPAGSITPAACPRCRSGKIRTLGKSPVAAVWTIFGCPTCFYAWRSTEPEENINPDKYPAAFGCAPTALQIWRPFHRFRREDQRNKGGVRTSSIELTPVHATLRSRRSLAGTMLPRRG